MRAVLVRGGTAVVVLSTVLAGLVLPVALAGAAAAAGGSAVGLAKVGTTDPATGFPLWYQDTNGVRVEPCVDSSGFCAAGTTLPNPDEPASVPANFPDETFYYSATSTMNVAAGVKAVLTMGVEAAFGNVDGAVIDHDQITFSRIQIKVASGLQPGATYTITSPYGVDTVQADDTGAILPPRTPASRYERGCGGAPPDCDFGLLLSGRVGPFLTTDGSWTPPAGYLGDGASAHSVTGSPFGTNVFAIDGPGIGTGGGTHAQTDQFVLSGKVAGPVLLDHNEVRFPGTDVDTAATTQHLTLTNVGADAVTVHAAMAAEGDVSAALGTCDHPLARDASCDLDVDFTPTAQGPRDGTLLIDDGAAQQLRVPVRGLGRAAGSTSGAALSTDSLTFADTQVGAHSAAHSVQLDNTGDAPLTVFGIGLHGSGTAARDYRLDRGTCGDTVAPGASCTVTVVFSPHTGGPRSASLVFTDDAGDAQQVALTGTATAGLVAVSPSPDPATGFPRWYEDSTGTRLRPCVESAAFCPAGATLPNGGAAPSVPDNFPSEGFFFLAQSTMTLPTAATGGGGGGGGGGGAAKAVFVAAVEAAFGNVAGVVTPGEQITFSRIQVKVTGGLVPGATYTITDPYGVETITADVTGAIKPPKTTSSRYEYGCGAVPPACDFGVLLGGRIGPFLQQDTSDGSTPPAGFLGDGVTEHAVTGSPFGTNFFRIQGPKPGGGTLSVTQPLFTLNGMRADGPSTPDLAAFSDTGSSSTDDVTKATNLTFTGGASASVPVTLYVDGTAVDTETSDDKGLYSLTARDVGELPNGAPHQVTATELLANGHESASSAARSVTVDRTAPVAPQITSTFPVSPDTTTTPFVLGFAEEGATVDIYGGPGCTGPVLGSDTGLRFGIGIAATVGANRTTQLAARQTDLAGNLGPCSAGGFPYTNDSVPPPAPAFADGSTSGTIRSTTATFAFSDSEPGTFQCQLDGSPFAVCASPQTYGSLSEGAHTVAVRAVDAAGNTGPAATRTVTVDTTGPTASLADTSATSFATPHPVFAFRLSEPGSASCALDPVSPAFAPCSSPADFGALANGTYTFRVRGTDLAGNTGPVTSVQMTVDTAAPSATITAGPTGATADPTPAFAFASADPAATFACGFAPAGAPVPALTPCTSPVKAPVLSTGTFRFFVRATDTAGNSTLASRLVVIDRSAPIAPRSLVARSASRTAIALTWQAVGDTTKVVYRVFRDGSNAPRALVSGTTWTDTRVRPGTKHSYRLVAVDAAGNTSGSSATVRTTASRDLVAPRISTSPRVTVTGRAHGRVDVTVAWAASDAGGVASYTAWQRTGNGAWQGVHLSSRTARSVHLRLPTGRTYAFRVQATDRAGHRSPRVTGLPVRL